jgi:hypothetical protein
LQEAERAVQDLERWGAVPSVAQATQRPFWDAVESYLSAIPGGAGVIRKRAEETRRKIADQIDNRFGLTSFSRSVEGQPRLVRAPSEPFIAGKVVKEGIEGELGFIERFKKKSSLLYSALDNFIPPVTPATTANTRVALEELTGHGTLLETYPALRNILMEPAVMRLREALPGEAVPFEILQQMRSAIGRKLGEGSLISDIPRGQLKQLYGALTEDLRHAAANAGPSARFAFDRATKYYRAGMQRIDDILDPLVRKNIPENVYNALYLSTQRGPTQIRAVMRSLEPEQRRVVSRTVISRLGRATPGQQGAEGMEFSFNTFLTNWNRVDKNAKNALFEGPGLAGYRADLDALARASERIRESSQAFGQGVKPPVRFVGAGAIYGAMTLGGGLFLGPLGALGGVATTALGANGLARLVTSEKFVRWLASGTKMRPERIGGHIGNLVGVAAASDPEIRETILAYSDMLLQVLGQGEAGGSGEPPK